MSYHQTYDNILEDKRCKAPRQRLQEGIAARTSMLVGPNRCQAKGLSPSKRSNQDLEFSPEENASTMSVAIITAQHFYVQDLEFSP